MIHSRERAVLVKVVIVWIGGMLLAVSTNSMLFGWNGDGSGTASGRESLALSLSMGIVWVAAMVPIWVMGTDAFPRGYFVAASIRVLGTVALFFLGSYTTRASAESLAVWILGWHGLLLVFEVLFRAWMPVDSPHDSSPV